MVDDEVLRKVEELSLLAPLHNPANAAGIRAFREICPNITSVVVFDTSFHTTMPEKAYRYPLPTKYYTENKVRKYGAHGTSHQYVAGEAAKLLGKPLEELKLITCHVGNGVSVTAVDKGISVDTSMGFTPLGGVMMGTRTGDLDPAIIPYLMEHTEDFSKPEDISRILNRESGLLGVSESSSDMRDIHTAMHKMCIRDRLMIEYGEVKSKLGSELEIYAEKTWEDFFRRVHKAMNVIQPLVFVFVALVIVLLYAAMLLPIYQNMEVHL